MSSPEVAMGKPKMPKETSSTEMDSPEKNKKQERVLRQLNIATSRLKEEMKGHELIREAEKLVKEGVLFKHVYPPSAETTGVPAETVYSVRGADPFNHEEPSFHNVFIRYITGGFRLSAYDGNGREIKMVHKHEKDGTLDQLEKTYFDNGQVKSWIEIRYEHDKMRKATYEFDENGGSNLKHEDIPYSWQKK